MHYFQFNIGDYASHTRYLTPMQDLAYRRLIDFYYLQEKPIPLENSAALIGLDEYRTDVEHVLNTFFVLSKQGWVNKRVEKEIAKYRGTKVVKSLAGKKSGEVRRANKLKAQEQKMNTCSTGVEQNSDSVELTNNHKPRKDIARPDGVLESVWDDFVKHRKAKKAPLTETALRGIDREARKAGISLNDALQEMCARGWTGFKADWMTDKTKSWADQQREWVAQATGKAYEPDVFDIAMANARSIK